MCYPSIDPLLLPFCQWQASQWMTSKVCATFSVTNPATGDVIAMYPTHTIEDVKTAIKFYVELLKNIEYQHNFKYF